MVLAALDCAGALPAALVAFLALHCHPVVAAGSVNTSGWLPEQDVPTPTENAAVPLAVTAVGEVQPPDANVTAVGDQKITLLALERGLERSIPELLKDAAVTFDPRNDNDPLGALIIVADPSVIKEKLDPLGVTLAEKIPPNPDACPYPTISPAVVPLAVPACIVVKNPGAGFVTPVVPLKSPTARMLIAEIVNRLVFVGVMMSLPVVIVVT